MSETQYLRASSVSHAIDALKAANGDGVIIAGGVVVDSLLNSNASSLNPRNGGGLNGEASMRSSADFWWLRFSYL